MQIFADILASAVLFWAVTRFCRKQGLFDPGSMGLGQFFAGVLYVICWAIPSLLICILHALGH